MTDPHSPIRTYVLDTSVLLSDPWACTRFAEHEVVVPLVVISELEAKRHHHELGWFARQALRLFDDLRLEHGRLDVTAALHHVGTLAAEHQVRAFGHAFLDVLEYARGLAFIDLTIPHHESAVFTSEVVVAEATHAEIRDFAQRVIEAQRTEIEQLQQIRLELTSSATPES